MVLVVNRISKEPIRMEFYLAFDTAWFSAFYNDNGIWTYNGREIFPTHWAHLPDNPTICEDCNGTGIVIFAGENVCPTCDGK